MGIEKDIQQRKFRNEFQKATVNIIFSANWLQEKIKLFLEQEDITIQQYNILRILRGSNSPLSTLQIRERMLDKMSDTSRIAERLVKKELIKKETSTADKRLVDIVITEKGLEALQRLDERNSELDNIVASLTEQEAIMLNGLLDKIRSR
jgi:DNA-binding MarR family transcriptional regulator